MYHGFVEIERKGESGGIMGPLSRDTSNKPVDAFLEHCINTSNFPMIVLNLLVSIQSRHKKKHAYIRPGQQ